MSHPPLYTLRRADLAQVFFPPPRTGGYPPPPPTHRVFYSHVIAQSANLDSIRSAQNLLGGHVFRTDGRTAVLIDPF